jgi:tripartite-type tricarboxylate transporter receptor subunit TctC
MLERCRRGKVRMVHPVQRRRPAVTDALSGQFEVLSVNAGPIITERQNRAPATPGGGRAAPAGGLQVPTLAELGYPAARTCPRSSASSHRPTCRCASGRINGEINKALETPEVRNRLLASENVPRRHRASSRARSPPRPTTRRRSSRPWASKAD